MISYFTIKKNEYIFVEQNFVIYSFCLRLIILQPLQFIWWHFEWSDREVGNYWTKLPEYL